MSDRTAVRASGLTSGHESAKEVSKEDEVNPHAEPPIEHTRQFRTPGFYRMRATFDSEDLIFMQRIMDWAKKQLERDFPEIYGILRKVDLICAVPELDADGVVVTDEEGMPVWKRNELGLVMHNWNKLTVKEREDILYDITINLGRWEQRAVDAWQMAMNAKVVWEERYAIKYDEPKGKTMGEREAIGKTGAIDERYQAMQLSAYSRRADALVNSMKRLADMLEFRQRGF